MKRGRTARSHEKIRARWGWLFVAPGIFFFSVFSFYPILNAFWTSFFNKKLLSLKAPKFIGFQNYEKVLASPDFWNSVRATAAFSIGAFVPLFVLSLLFAVLIASRKRFQRGAQMALYSPAVLSSAVAALIWLLVFDPRGLANHFVNLIAGTPGIDHRWLADATMAQVSTIVVYVWKYVGYFTILFVTGIGKIPQSVNEAALIDGAGPLQRLFRITLPLLKPTTVLVSVMILIQCLKTFSTQYLFTQRGAPLQPVNVLTLNIYNTALRDQNLGRASVMSVLLFVFMLFLSWAQLRFSRSEEAEL
ncbi:MAG: sugar ABC transporter permease [Spirochaetaceae bacterium]|nr:sugar ABC transporter permease [Spirochaetaceae bacterium]